MASNSINFKINFDTNTSGIVQAQKALEQLRNLSNKDIAIFNNTGLDETGLKKARSIMMDIQTESGKAQKAMEAAFNQKLGTVNMERFREELQKNGTSLEQFRNTMAKAGPIGEKAFTEMAAGLSNVKYQTVQTTTILDKMTASLQRSLTTFVSINIINKVKGSINEAYGYVKNLDTSLNQIRIVTGKSADEMDRFAEKANKAAASLGKATTDYTKASTTFYQQGLGDTEVQARTDVTLKAANTTGQDSKVVADNLTALWNGFNVGAEEAEIYVDRLAALAATTASNLDELTTAMSKTASMASVMGVSEEQLAAQIATVVSVTRQAPESVGTAFKSIYSRISDINAGAEDAETTLGNYSSKLAALGINVLDSSGKLRNMGEVIEEVGGKWKNYSKEQQVAIAGIMGGQRQVNQVTALFDNWDEYTESIETMANAEGTLQKQQDVYMESAQGQLQKLRTEWEGVLDSLLSSDDIIKVAKAIQPIFTSLEKVIDAFGGGVGILTKFSPLLFGLVSPKISEGIAKIGMSFENTKINAEIAKSEVEGFQAQLNEKVGEGAGLSGYTQQIQDLINKYGELRDSMSVEQKNQFKESLNQLIENEGPKARKELEEYQKSLRAIYELDAGKDNNILKDVIRTEDKDKLDEYNDKLQELEKTLNGSSEDIKKNFSNIKQQIQQTLGDSDIGKELVDSIEQNIASADYSKAAKALSDSFGDQLNDVSGLDMSVVQQKVNETFKEGTAEAQRYMAGIEALKNAQGQLAVAERLEADEAEKANAAKAEAEHFEALAKDTGEKLKQTRQEQTLAQKEQKEILDKYNISQEEGITGLRKYLEVVEAFSGEQSMQAYELRDAIAAYEQYDETVENTQNQIEALRDIQNQETAQQRAAMDIADQHSATRKEYNRVLEETREKIAEIRKQLREGAITEQEANEMIADTARQGANAIHDLGEAVGQTADQMSNVQQQSAQTSAEVLTLRQSFEEIRKISLAQDFMNIAQAGIAVFSSISSIKNLGNIWEDDDLTTGEKIANTFTTLATTIPIFVSSLKQAKVSIQEVTAKLSEQNTVAAINKVLMAPSPVSIGRKGNASSTLADAGSAMYDQSMADMTKTFKTEGFFKGLKAGLHGVQPEMQAVTAGMGEMEAGMVTATNSATSLGASIGGMIPILAAAVAVIGAIAGAVIFYQHQNETAADRMEKEREKQKKIIESYEEMKVGIENYTESKKELDKLTKGTDEYNKALDEQNKKIQELIEKYPQLRKAMHYEGNEMILDQDAVNDELQKEQDKADEAQRKILKKGLLKEGVNTWTGGYAFATKEEREASKNGTDKAQNKVQLTEIGKTYSKYKDISAETMSEIIQFYQDMGFSATEIADKLENNTEEILTRAEIVGQKIEKFASEGVNINAILAGDISSVSKEEYDKLLKMTDDELRQLGLVTEEEIQNFKNALHQGYKETISGLPEIFQDEEGNINEQWKNLDENIVEKFKNQAGKINNEVLNNLGTGLQNLGKNVDVDQFASILSDMDWSQGEDSLNNFKEQIEALGLNYEKLPEEVQKYVEAQLSANSVWNSSINSLESLTTAMGQISKMKFGDMLSEKDYQELVGRFSGLENYFQKVGEKYEYTATNNKKVLDELKKAYREQTEELKGLDTVQIKGSSERMSKMLGKGLEEQSKATNDFILKNLTTRQISALTGYSEDDALKMLSKNAVGLQGEELEEYLAFIKKIEDAQEIEKQRHKEFIAAQISSLQELDAAVADGTVSYEAAAEKRDFIRNKELQSLGVTEEAYKDYLKSIGKSIADINDTEIMIKFKIDLSGKKAAEEVGKVFDELSKNVNDAEKAIAKSNFTNILKNQLDIDADEFFSDNENFDLFGKMVGGDEESEAALKQRLAIKQEVLLKAAADAQMRGDEARAAELRAEAEKYETLDEWIDNYSEYFKTALEQRILEVQKGINEINKSQKEFERSQTQRDISKVENKMAHATGKEYVALYKQREELRAQELEQMEEIQNLNEDGYKAELKILDVKNKETGVTVENIQAKLAEGKTIEAIIESYKDDAAAQEAALEVIKTINNQEIDRAKTEQEIADYYEEQFQTLTKIDDLRRKGDLLSRETQSAQKDAQYMNTKDWLGAQSGIAQRQAAERANKQELRTEYSNKRNEDLDALIDLGIDRSMIKFDKYGGIANMSDIDKYAASIGREEEIKNLMNSVNECADSVWDLDESLKTYKISIDEMNDEQAKITSNDITLSKLQEEAQGLTGKALLDNLSQQKKIQNENKSLYEGIANYNKNLQASLAEGFEDQFGIALEIDDNGIITNLENVYKAIGTLTDEQKTQFDEYISKVEESGESMRGARDAAESIDKKIPAELKTQEETDIETYDRLIKESEARQANMVEGSAEWYEEEKKQDEYKGKKVETYEKIADNKETSWKELTGEDPETALRKMITESYGELINDANSRLAKLDKNNEGYEKAKKEIEDEIAGYTNDMAEDLAEVGKLVYDEVSRTFTGAKGLTIGDTTKNTVDKINEAGSESIKARSEAIVQAEEYKGKDSDEIADKLASNATARAILDKEISSLQKDLDEASSPEERAKIESDINEKLAARRALLEEDLGLYEKQKENLKEQLKETELINGETLEKVDIDLDQTMEDYTKDGILDVAGFKEAIGYDDLSKTSQETIDGIIKNFEEVNEKILDTEENLRTVKLPYNEYEEFEREIKRIEKAEKELQTQQDSLNNKIKDSERILSDLQSEAEFLIGDDLVANLEQQSAEIEKQIEYKKEQLEIDKKSVELARQKAENAEKEKAHAQDILDRSKDAISSAITSTPTKGIRFDKDATQEMKDQAFDFYKNFDINDWLDEAGSVKINELRAKLTELGLDADYIKTLLDDYEKAQNKVNEATDKATTATKEYDDQLQKEADDQQALIDLGREDIKIKREQAQQKLQTGEEAINRETTAQHKLEKALRDVDKAIQQVQRDQNDLIGPTLISKIQEEIRLQEKKREVLEDQLVQMNDQINSLKELYSNFLLEEYGIDITFEVDETGVKNLDEIYAIIDTLDAKDKGIVMQTMQGIISTLDSSASTIASISDSIDNTSNSIGDLSKKLREARRDIKEHEEEIERETNLQHQLAKALREVDKEIQNVQRDQEGLSGQALITKIQEEIELQKKKKEILKQQLEQIKKQIQALISLYSLQLRTQYGIGVGIAVDETGVSNIDQLYAAVSRLGDEIRGPALQDIQSFVSAINSLAGNALSVKDSIDGMDDSIEDLNKKLREASRNVIKDYEEEIKRETNLQHQLAKALREVDKEIQNIQRDQEGLSGQVLVDKVQKEIGLQQKKKEILEQQLSQIDLQIKSLANLYSLQLMTQYGIGTGIIIDETGVSNIDQLYAAVAGLDDKIKNEATQDIQNYISAINSLSSSALSTRDSIEEMQNSIENSDKKIREAYRTIISNRENEIRRETTALHDLELSLHRVDLAIQKIQKDQEELNGSSLIESIEKEIKLQEKKKDLLEQQLKQQQKQIETFADMYAISLADQYGIEVNIQLDDQGIANVDDLYQAAAKLDDRLKGEAIQDIQNYVSQLNSLSGEILSNRDSFGEMLDTIDDLNKKIKEIKEAELFRIKEENWYKEEQALKKIDKVLKEIQKDQNKLSGDALIANLEAQQKLLNRQIKTYQEKLSLMNVELQSQRSLLEERGIEFNEEGIVTNYAAVMKNADEKTKNYLQSYQQLYNDILDLEDTVQDVYDQREEIEEKKIQERLKMFNAKIDVELDLTKVKREWQAFKREFLNTLNNLEELNDSILEKTKQNIQDIYSMTTKDVTLLTQHVNKIIEEIKLMQEGGVSELYGTDQTTALSDLAKYRQQIQDSLSSIADKTREVNKAYLQQLDKISKKFDEQLSNYELIQNIITHDINLIKILKGDKAYEELNRYYDKATANYEQEIDFLRKQVDYWRQLMEQEPAGSEKWEYFQEHWKDALSKLNSAVDAALNNIVAKYDTKIQAIFQKIKTGSNLDWKLEKWDLDKQLSKMFTDQITTEYSLQKLQDKYIQAAADTDDINKKQKILDIMRQQINAYRELSKESIRKGRLTEREIELANKQYELEMARINLQDQEQNKTKMRLRRDSSGNYRYEFVADEEKVEDIKSKILDLEEEIRLFAEETRQQVIDTYAQAVQTALNGMQNAYQDWRDGVITDEELKERLAYYKDWLRQMGEATDTQYSASVKILTKATEDEIRDLGAAADEDVEHLKQHVGGVTEHIEGVEGQIGGIVDYTKGVMESLYPVFGDSFYSLSDQINEINSLVEDGTDELLNIMDEITEEFYQIESIAGLCFDSIINGNDETIDQMEQLIDTDYELLDQYEAELDEIDMLIDELNNLQEAYMDVYDAALMAVDAALDLTETVQQIPDYSDLLSQNFNISSGGYFNNSSSGNHSYNPYQNYNYSTVIAGNSGVYSSPPSSSSSYSNASSYVNYINQLLDQQPTENDNTTPSSTSSGINKPYRGWMQRNYTITVSSSNSNSLEQLKRKTTHFASGGYTGEWGEEGKIAILHEKELVLNKNDTKNILDTISILKRGNNSNNYNNSDLKDISNFIDKTYDFYSSILNIAAEQLNSLIATASLVTQIANNNTTNNINANFPNATQYNEIEKALQNLGNATSQRIGTNKRK